MAGVTIQGTIWAQWVHAVSTGGTHTLNVVMNNRDITVLTALRSYSVIHPAQYHIGVFWHPGASKFGGRHSRGLGGRMVQWGHASGPGVRLACLRNVRCEAN
jgi:hypothetical protein